MPSPRWSAAACLGCAWARLRGDLPGCGRGGPCSTTSRGCGDFDRPRPGAAEAAAAQPAGAEHAWRARRTRQALVPRLGHLIGRLARAVCGARQLDIGPQQPLVRRVLRSAEGVGHREDLARDEPSCIEFLPKHPPGADVEGPVVAQPTEILRRRKARKAIDDAERRRRRHGFTGERARKAVPSLRCVGEIPRAPAEQSLPRLVRLLAQGEDEPCTDQGRDRGPPPGRRHHNGERSLVGDPVQQPGESNDLCQRWRLLAWKAVHLVVPIPGPFAMVQLPHGLRVQHMHFAD
mmetsp:Transcript_280/g.962  ORF Transcript_280/g.962 Transcript_280/m.962 type:complete len:291 (+) Transcript_280:1061-1933(+)